MGLLPTLSRAFNWLEYTVALYVLSPVTFAYCRLSVCIEHNEAGDSMCRDKRFYFSCNIGGTFTLHIDIHFYTCHERYLKVLNVAGVVNICNVDTILFQRMFYWRRRKKGVKKIEGNLKSYFDQDHYKHLNFPCYCDKYQCI